MVCFRMLLLTFFTTAGFSNNATSDPNAFTTAGFSNNATSDPNAWCTHPSDCTSDEVCCLCNCLASDATLGSFGCSCKSDGTAKPSSEQTHCCGGESGFQAWCAKANTPSFTEPKCNTTYNTFGVPTPPANFYQFGQHRRCIKQSVGCNAGFCDNSSPDAQHRGLCNRL